jgi:hypothetical protein
MAVSGGNPDSQMELDELHDMVMFLKEELTAGRIKVSSKFTVDALARVRFGCDGKVDPSTVDGLRAGTWARRIGGKVPSRGERDAPSGCAK